MQDYPDRAALAAGREELATEAAETIAGLENELRLRRETLDRLDAKIVRLTRSVEAGQRRMIELRQGAVQARAVKREAEIQSRAVGLAFRSDRRGRGEGADCPGAWPG